MILKDCLFTSESVTEGHPDKIADQISDSILDAVLTQDPRGRVAAETLVTTGLVMVAGEISTSAVIDIPALARETIKRIGYEADDMGFDYKTCGVITTLDKQSPDIAQGVTEGQGKFKEQGAGDQGIMFGYACDETPEFMPATLAYSHRLTKRLAECRKEGILGFLRPDGKAQVTVEYDETGAMKRVEAIVVSTQHSAEVSQEELETAVREEVIFKSVPAKLIDSKTKIYVNPTGRFVIGGPMGDCGLTGRKIIVDTYGGHGAHGGGAFSGKDPSKVDRSASYMARYIAKNIVAAGLSRRCLVQLAYAIGVAEPVSLYVYDYDTGTTSSEKISSAVREMFGLKPAELIKTLDLCRPIYEETAAYGHFGRTSAKGFTWENLNRVDDLKSLAKN
ncbi:MAG: methionine adenosyltransferase [Bdellovibrionaceae bacterium]|nr:methionine adenosyltransferase [Bdellovibrionales bacterium]MCB9253313.1 methionine adenosyltransferase [Pseudobdellovibrionaceae bacterium]